MGVRLRLGGSHIWNGSIKLNMVSVIAVLDVKHREVALVQRLQATCAVAEPSRGLVWADRTKCAALGEGSVRNGQSAKLKPKDECAARLESSRRGERRTRSKRHKQQVISIAQMIAMIQTVGRWRLLAVQAGVQAEQYTGVSKLNLEKSKGPQGQTERGTRVSIFNQ